MVVPTLRCNSNCIYCQVSRKDTVVENDRFNMDKSTAKKIVDMNADTIFLICIPSAGLELLRRNMKGNSIKRHLEPKARLELGQKIAKMGVNSMIDASDGLADIRHICDASNTGALIYADKIPISPSTKEDSRALGKNALDFALYGGEDYELIFTAPKSSLAQFEKIGAKAIGEIKGRKYGVKLFKDGKQADLMNGFDHFQS